MDQRFLAAVVGWLFPGAGHAITGRWNKALIFGGVIWTLYIVSIWGGGAYYPDLEWEEGPLLVLLNVFSRSGNVVGAVISWMISATPSVNIAELATFEYSGRLLEVAGMLNYLAAMDAYSADDKGAK